MDCNGPGEPKNPLTGKWGAELSSLTTALADLAGRITAMAESSGDDQSAPLSMELFEVERSLGEALRRLERLTAS